MSYESQYLAFTHDNFRSEVLEAKVPVLVDCWATWCSPNLIISSAVHALATDFTRPIKVGRLNVAEFECLAKCYGIRVVPTLLVFH
jgi:thioredoxin-like negative regulator of GroEL